MTRDEAKAILGADKPGRFEPWLDTDDVTGDPQWWRNDRGATITLDGDFTKEELLAILAFHPDDKEKTP